MTPETMNDEATTLQGVTLTSSAAAKVQELIQAEGDASLKLVFVSACYSQDAGEAFLDAGVKHVVAVRWNEPINDKAAAIFSTMFYAKLMAGDTIYSAYEAGKAFNDASCSRGSCMPFGQDEFR